MLLRAPPPPLPLKNELSSSSSTVGVAQCPTTDPNASGLEAIELNYLS